MPTYEYRCKACGHELEAVQAFTDDPLTECPDCGGALRKKFGTVGITFKGSGFYKTDSRSGPSSTTKATADASSGDGGSSGSTPPETGSATKTAADSSSSSSAASPSSSPSSTASAPG